MGEAFDGIDEYCWTVQNDIEHSSPDAAHDCIFMMHGDDWQSLREALPARPVEWRGACFYVLGYGPPDECLPLLETAVLNEEGAVAAEAAVSYAAQVLEHGLIAAVPSGLAARLRAIADACSGQHVEEVIELLQRLDEGKRSG